MRVTGAVDFRSRDSACERKAGGVEVSICFNLGNPTAVFCFLLAVVVPGILTDGI